MSQVNRGRGGFFVGRGGGRGAGRGGRGAVREFEATIRLEANERWTQLEWKSLFEYRYDAGQ